MFEVERKYRVRRADFAVIMVALFKRLLTAKPVMQRDCYLCCDDPQVTLRVRREESQQGTVFLRTEKRKCKVGPNTNQESETEISGDEYERLVKEHQATLYESPLLVYKERIHFYGSYGGRAVTICLDRVRGPGGIQLGYAVELETMVEETSAIPNAHAVLKALAGEVLPSSRKREKRGYRTMLMEALTRKEKQRRRKEAKRAAKQAKKRKGKKK